MYPNGIKRVHRKRSPDLKTPHIEMDYNLLPGQSLAHILPPSWKADVQRWFAEDTPSFDWAGFVVGEEEQEAILWGKSGVGMDKSGGNV